MQGQILYLEDPVSGKFQLHCRAETFNLRLVRYGQFDYIAKIYILPSLTQVGNDRTIKNQGVGDDTQDFVQHGCFDADD